MKIRSISMRIWLSFTILISIIVTMLSISHFINYSYINIENQKSDLLTIHNILIEQDFDRKIRFEDLRNLQESQHFVKKDKEIIPINSFPEIQVRTTNPEIKIDIRDEISKLAKGNLNKAYFKHEIDNIKYMVYITSFENAYFISYMPILNHDKTMNMIILIGMLFIFGALISTIIVSKSITKPLKDLETFTNKIAKKDFSATIDIESDDEIGSLAQSMLKMKENLKKVDEEEKQFFQSISHDLKTPVAVILAHAESIIDGIYIDTPEKTAEIIKNEAINLDKKIKKLLYFNTLDFTLANQEELELINLKDLLLTIVSRLKSIKTNISWEVNAEDILFVADYDKLSVSIENILDNAMRYAKSKISIDLKVEKDKIIIKIFNDGEEINPYAIEKIFNNMYKDKKGNFGLGLAISQKIIQHYNGEIFAQNVKNGVNFLINFPFTNIKRED